MSQRADVSVRRAADALGARAATDVAIGPMTTYRVGGSAALHMVVESEADMADIGEAVRSSGVQVLLVGNGSNLLISDDGFAGLAVTLGEVFGAIEVDGTRVRAWGAAQLPVVARRTASAGLTGFEWAVGVPGSVGGAVRMNAGGHGSDMAETLRRVRVFDLATDEVAEVDVARLDLGYRRSSILSSQIVIWADLDLRHGDGAAAEREIAEIVRWRREHQPGGQNAGSVFTNPPGDSAGRLIEAAGCKGLRVGSAAVSTKHANFIQTEHGGAAGDVLALMEEIRRRVLAGCGIDLQAETRLVGFAGGES